MACENWKIGQERELLFLRSFLRNGNLQGHGRAWQVRGGVTDVEKMNRKGQGEKNRIPKRYSFVFMLHKADEQSKTDNCFIAMQSQPYASITLGHRSGTRVSPPQDRAISDTRVCLLSGPDSGARVGAVHVMHIRRV